MDNDDLMNYEVDKLKDEGFKDIYQKRRAHNYKQAAQDYERFLSNSPYLY